jgi:hypothetical protein
VGLVAAVGFLWWGIIMRRQATAQGIVVPR